MNLLMVFSALLKFLIKSESVKRSLKIVSTSVLYMSLMMVRPICSEQLQGTSPRVGVGEERMLRNTRK